jgi:ankyrin repeat protein
MRRAIRTLAWIGLVWAASAAVPPETPVADAARRGDLDAVRRLVETGADVNTPHGDGMTALHWAAENGDVEIVEVLIYAGAHLEAVTRNGGYTPLHLASAVGRLETMEALLQAGADVSRGTTTGVTALHYAGASGSATAVDLLLEYGAEVGARESVWGQTPLVFASAAGRLETVRALIDGGSDLAATTNVVDVAEIIAEDVEFKARRDAIKAVEWGLDLADQGYAGTGGRQDEQLREELEEKKGPLEMPDSVRERLSFAQLMAKKGGLSSLHHAAREGYADVALELISRGADVNQISGDGSTPLLVATINGHFDLGLALLEQGADPNLRSVAGSGPLYAALNLQWAATSWYPQPTAHKQQEASYLDYMRALLDAGADPNARLEMELWYTEFSGGNLSVSQWGATPFWRAAYGTDVAAMRLLMEYGADPTIPTKKLPERSNQYGEEVEGYPYPPVPTGGPATYPIHAATGAGYGLGFAGNAHQHAPDGWLPSVRYLIEELGVDPNLRDHHGYTAVHNAATRGDNEVIRYLVSKGADVTLVSRYGQTTADMANGPYQRLTPFPETLALLEGLGAVNNHNCVGC